MSNRRLVATLFAASLFTAAVIPLVGASTEQTFNGDVIINGNFVDGTPIGYPTKLYCDANNPTPAAGPNGECAHANAFVAYDWTSPVDMAASVVLVEGGIQLTNGAFIQQHFNGSDAPDRKMRFFALEIVAHSNTASSASFRAEIRANTTGSSTAENYGKPVTVGTSSTTIRLGPADLAAYDAGSPALSSASEIGLRSVRLWANAGADITIERVSVYATNGIEGRNILILPTGDDEVSSVDGVALLNAGDDGKYSFLVGIARDTGEFLFTRDAWVCAFTAEQAFADRGYPTNTPDEMCVDSFLDPESPRITKTREGNAIRVDVPADMIAPSNTEVPLVSFYAHVKIDGAYDDTPSTSAEFKSGYFNLARMAAANAGAGVSIEAPFPTPVLIDANGDGTPDYVQTDEMDGYSVIVTPRAATQTPFATVMAASDDGFYEFEVQVFQYTGTSGAAIPLTHGIAFALFNGEGLVNGGTFDASPFWSSEGDAAQSLLPDGKTMLVRVPADEIADQPVAGAWAFYDVQAPFRWNVASEPYGGYSQSATDFYSVLRNTVKDVVVADGLRSMATPIVFDSMGLTAVSTTVIRMDPEADTLTPLDGTIVVDDAGDGTISFEYALIGPSGLRTATGHGFAIYDAAGAASDDLQPGLASGMEHAEWTGEGVLQSNGWYRVDVPVSAFDEAQGPVGAWAYAHDATSTGLVCCSTWYNPLKGTVAGVSRSAAEALYGPTPIVIVDDQLGIPKTLVSAMSSVGAGLFTFTNPLVNPGFEVDLQVEGRKDTADNTGATMTTPPWFFRLDDGINGGTQPTNPKSTHEVAAGAGRVGDSALKIKYNILDDNKGLMLGQLLGAEPAPAAKSLVWRGATGAAFDVKLASSSSATFTATLRWLDADGALHMTSATKTVLPSMQWQRPTFALSVPADGQLLGFYISLDPASTMTIYLDNVVLEGAKTALGDARSDLTDGYAVIIEPQELSGAEQSLVEGAGGLGYYLYDVTVVDYTAGAPQTLVTQDMPKSFGLRTEAMTRDIGTILQLRGEDDVFVAALPADIAPATPAAPWAWVGAGEGYSPFNGPFPHSPASGYYSPVKNALAGASFADQLDYAGTPVTFGTDVAREQLGEQQLSLAPAPGGGWLVRVEADTPFVETTTVTITRPNVNAQSFPVTLASEGGDLVPGLVIPDAQLAATTITSADSLFTTGDVLVAGSPSATWQVCRAVLEGCQDAGIESLESLIFRAVAVSPSGESLTYVWKFTDQATGQSQTKTTTQTDLTHSFSTPGTKTVNLTAQTPSGKKGWYEGQIVVSNLAPTLSSLTINPNPANTDSLVRLRAFASDPDNGALQYTWRIDGVVIPDATGASVLLTPSVLESVLPGAVLELGTYDVSVSVIDGQGSTPITMSRELTVVPKVPVLSALTLAVDGVEGATYALTGETVLVSVAVSDPDAQATGIVLREATDAIPELVLSESEPGVFTGSFVAGAPALLDLAAVATTLGDDVVGDASEFEVRADAAPELTLTGPTLIEAGEEATFTVTAVDPDNRTLGAFEWTVDGAAVAADGASFTATFAQWGFYDIDVSVDGASAGLVLGVDDFVTVTIEIVQAGETPTDGNLVQVTLKDADGNPIANEDVVVQDFIDMFPAPVQTKVVTTDANGQSTFRMDPEGAGLLALPVAHTLLATVSANSLPGAPEPGFEVDQAEVVYDNMAGPYALELLP